MHKNSNRTMKSAYELTLERLNKQNPQSKISLSKAQKEQIAEVDRRYQAKIAERELSLKPQIEKARFGDDPTAIESLEKQLHGEIMSLREEMEREKEKVRKGL